MDPKAEDYDAWSPYNYVFNNPVKLVDPDGRGPRPGPGPGIGSNPFYSITEGARQIQQAAGSIIL